VFNALAQGTAVPTSDPRASGPYGQRGLSQIAGNSGAHLAHRATLLFSPPYSPDRNPIEHDFAVIKKRLEYQEPASLDQIVKAYQ